MSGSIEESLNKIQASHEQNPRKSIQSVNTIDLNSDFFYPQADSQNAIGSRPLEQEG